MRVLPVPDVQQQRYRPEIEGSGALAVVAVVINYRHDWALLSGCLGVGILFVVFGFVITASLARLLRPRNVPLVVLDGTVSMPQHPALCSRTRQGVMQRYARFEELLRASMARLSNLSGVRFWDGLCLGAVCRHLTDAASAELAPLLQRRLAQAGMAP